MWHRANGGAAMDVGGWLRRLGLEQYEAAFRENAISEKVLPNLTAEDLKDLGVRHGWAPPQPRDNGTANAEKPECLLMGPGCGARLIQQSTGRRFASQNRATARWRTVTALFRSLADIASRSISSLSVP